MKRYSTRIAAGALIGTLALGAAAAPCVAAEATGTKPATSLTRLSPATQRLLMARSDTRARRVRQQSAPADQSGSFFHSRRGAIALALMGAGAGFAIWSANHDREPVKSPVR